MAGDQNDENRGFANLHGTPGNRRHSKNQPIKAARLKPKGDKAYMWQGWKEEGRKAALKMSGGKLSFPVQCRTSPASLVGCLSQPSEGYETH